MKKTRAEYAEDIVDYVAMVKPLGPTEKSRLHLAMLTIVHAIQTDAGVTAWERRTSLIENVPCFAVGVLVGVALTAGFITVFIRALT